MNNKVPTAEDFLNNQGVHMNNLQNLPWFDYGNILTWLEEFAKLHVRAALESAAENAKWDITNNNTVISVDKESILNSYPDENIQ